MPTNEELDVTCHDDHLAVRFKGEFNAAVGKAVVDTMVASCRQAGLSRILLDCREMGGAISILDRFDMAEYGARVIDRHITIALVGREEDILPDNFFENAAVSRGVRVKVFSDAGEAVGWLRTQA